MLLRVLNFSLKIECRSVVEYVSSGSGEVEIHRQRKFAIRILYVINIFNRIRMNFFNRGIKRWTSYFVYISEYFTYRHFSLVNFKVDVCFSLVRKDKSGDHLPYVPILALFQLHIGAGWRIGP